MKKVFYFLTIIMTICLLPMMASAYTVSWSDNGYGNDSNWYAMDAFTFVADNSGAFGSAPTVDGWLPGTVVNSGFAYVTGTALVPGDFNMSVDFQAQPLGATQFEYYGYVNGTAVKEGIIMLLSDGSWNYGWSYAELGSAPPVPQVPEPATMLLLGLGLVGVAGIKRKFKG
jgi:hypothetical protein